jgi:tRNA dimethylallyltransferase
MTETANPRKPLIVVVGPTAVGKTAFAVQLAKRFSSEIISADSRQIYRGFDLGTGKPTPAEMACVPHYLVSMASPRKAVTAARFARLAELAVQKIVAKQKNAWVVGGTGLWIRALVDGLAPTPPGDPEIRAQLQQHAREAGKEALHRELQAVDPVTAGRLHPSDLLRVIRALEIFRISGQAVSHMTAQAKPEPWPAFWLGLFRPRDEMYARAEARIEQCLQQGWLEEVRQLLHAGLEPSCPAFQALGYAHLVKYVQGETTWPRTVELIKRDTRRYIKRQLTWFRANPRITWLDVSNETQAIREAEIWLREKGDVYGR